jgi:hypothetical protein
MKETGEIARVSIVVGADCAWRFADDAGGARAIQWRAARASRAQPRFRRLVHGQRMSAEIGRGIDDLICAEHVAAPDGRREFMRTTQRPGTEIDNCRSVRVEHLHRGERGRLVNDAEPFNKTPTILQAMRMALYDTMPSREWLAYWRALELDELTIAATCAPLRLSRS